MESVVAFDDTQRHAEPATELGRRDVPRFNNIAHSSHFAGFLPHDDFLYLFRLEGMLLDDGGGSIDDGVLRGTATIRLIAGPHNPEFFPQVDRNFFVIAFI